MPLCSATSGCWTSPRTATRKPARKPRRCKVSAGTSWGSLQTNKARSVAGYAEVVHSVDRASLVSALDDGARRADRCLEVLLQVSLDGDPARGGVLPADLLPLADQVAAAEGLRLRGLMAVAPIGVDPALAFGDLERLAARLLAVHPSADAISAGMSADLEAAISAGATLVRVGTALLGHRTATLR